jgi:type II secretory pathway component PulC
MDKGTLKWLVLAAIAVCGMLGYKVATKASKDGKKEVVYERPEPRFGVVTAILYSNDTPTVLIEDQMLHEGDTIHDVKVMNIMEDKVQFDKQGERWEQKVQEPAKPEWWKRKGRETST